MKYQVGDHVKLVSSIRGDKEMVIVEVVPSRPTWPYVAVIYKDSKASKGHYKLKDGFIESKIGSVSLQDIDTSAEDKKYAMQMSLIDSENKEKWVKLALLNNGDMVTVKLNGKFQVVQFERIRKDIKYPIGIKTQRGANYKIEITALEGI